jgi:outer membrane protein assembly factor BamB
VASGPEPPYRTAWENTSLDSRPIAAPVVADGLVIVVTDRAVVALSADDGTEEWSVDREEGTGGAAVIVGETVAYVQGEDEEAVLVAAGLADGAELWTAPLGDSAPAPLAADEDTIFASTSQGIVHAVDVETGDEEWTFEADGEIPGAPAVAEGLVFVSAMRPSAQAGTVYALDADTGDDEWRYSPSGTALGFSSVAVAGDRAYLGVGDRAIRALGVEDGLEVWSFVARDWFEPRTMPAIAGDPIVVDRLGDVYRLGAGDGELAWDFRVPGFVTLSSPLVTEGSVVLGDDSGHVSAIDLDTGLLSWKGTFGEAALEAPASDGERIYLASRGGRVVALEHDPDGTLLAEPSPTTLFPVEALRNFLAAAAALAAFLLLVFRFLLPGQREVDA